MLKNYLGAAIAVGVLGLSACTNQAEISAMTYTPQTFNTPKRLSLLNNIDVKSVEGTQEISSGNFKAALVQSLHSAHLYKTLSKSQYALTADVVNLNQPFVGRTVKFKVHYRLQDVQKHIYLYDKDVLTSYTAQSSLADAKHLHRANESAARENIKQFIQDLYRLPRVV